MKLEEQTSRLAIDDSMAGAESPEGATPPVDTAAAASKPKRVRTGCLTCRERHLKCDEGTPTCQNCVKSNRECKRGMRLNFIDTKVEDTQIIPPTAEWKIGFQDESREIASEYKGGAVRYAVVPLEEEMDVKQDAAPQDQVPPAPAMSHQALPPMHSTPPEPPAPYPPQQQEYRQHHSHHSSTSTGSSTAYASSETSYTSGETLVNYENQTVLSSPEEVLFMQVFIEEVAIWMDSMDRHKHFSRILPFYALQEPMLRNALLACGARHLSLVNPAFHEDRALHYYDTATRALLKSLQNPNRDTIICATAAVVLNVYEVMSERALQRMNHIAGARALIKECGWSAQSNGIGLACFWLNVGMELLSCLHFNWQVAWNPDEWGVDLNMDPDRMCGNEEAWTYKIVYITAKVANFRASIPRFQEPNPTLQAMRVQRRVEEWESYKKLCDQWLAAIPQSMHPLGYLVPQHTATKSQFPEIWYVKRASITARLFYHTAMCILPQIHPRMDPNHPEMYELKMHHVHQICGIVAHVKDRGVASVAIRTLAIAAECLSDFREQSEILTILEKIKKETGWRIDFITPELKTKWGWTEEYVRHQQQMLRSFADTIPNDYSYQPSQPLQPPQSHSPPMPTQPPTTTSIQAPFVASNNPPMPRIPSGIINPLMRTADFNAPQHPYQNDYVPPLHNHNDGHFIYQMVDIRFR